MTKLIGIFSFFAFHTLNCMNISRVLPYTREPAKRYLLTQSTYNMVYFLFDEVKSHRRRRNSVSQSFLFNSKIRSENFIICPLNRREAQRHFIYHFNSYCTILLQNSYKYGVFQQKGPLKHELSKQYRHPPNL